MKTKIVITGSTGRFGTHLRKQKTKYKIFFPTKDQLDILDFKSIEKYLKKHKPSVLIHLAGLSRPMSIHEQNINKSIDLNIIGTSNVTKACSNLDIKLIYFSTNYVYPGFKGNFKETDSLKPVNNYAWSKLGGECAVHLYKNSLIIRACMTEKPFVHKKAFANVKTSFMYHDEAAKILFKLINQNGIINLGGKKQNIYLFAKKNNKHIKKIFLSRKNNLGMPFDSSLNIRKLNKILKNKKIYN